jgi:hypothetical protein
VPKEELKVRGAGAPTKYTDDMPDIVLLLMYQGATKAMLARTLQVDISTITEWQKDPTKPEFGAARRLGRDWAKGWMEEQALDNLKNPNFNAVLWSMQMRNRYGYSESPKRKIKNLADASHLERCTQIFKAIEEGELTADEAAKYMNIVATGAKIEEVTELRDIVEKLEKHVKGD